jgi:hypothetical protein
MNNTIKMNLTVMLILFFTMGHALARHDTSNQHMQYPTNTQKNYSELKEGDTNFWLTPFNQ